MPVQFSMPRQSQVGRSRQEGGMITHRFGPGRQSYVQPRAPACVWHAIMPAGQAPPSGAGVQSGGAPHVLHGRTQTFTFPSGGSPPARS